MCATWGISGDVWLYISIVVLCRYANHVCVSYTARTNYENESDLPPTTRSPSIFGKAFLWWGTYRISMLLWFYLCMCMNKINFENQLIQRKLKTKLSLKSNRFGNHILLVLPTSIGCNFVWNRNSELYPTLARLPNALWFLYSRFSQFSFGNRLNLRICIGILFYPEINFSRTPNL
jgi:hypothetical protein